MSGRSAWFKDVSIINKMIAGMFIATIALSLAVVSSAHAADTHAITGIAGKCLDVQGGKAIARNAVQIYTCNGTIAQQWEQPGDGTIRNQGLCLDVKEGGKRQETLVWLFNCNGTTAQQWNSNADSLIVSVHANLCLDDKRAGTKDRNPVWVYKCNATVSQQWTVAVPTPATTPSAATPTPVPAYVAPVSQTEEPAPVRVVYYKNCAAARAAGAAPVYRGQPGYASHLDRDNDGIGCE